MPPESIVPCEFPADSVRLYGTPLDACFDPDHGHQQGWLGNYDNGKMDGACMNAVTIPNGCSPGTPFPADTYVLNNGSPNGILQPYYDIATNYGFANYFFQTNQGPSFPAHQFLFTGTSAPDSYNDDPNCLGYPCWQWFAGEIPTGKYVGCSSPSGTQVYDISPHDGSEQYAWPPYGPMLQGPGFPCYDHPTLAT